MLDQLLLSVCYKRIIIIFIVIYNKRIQNPWRDVTWTPDKWREYIRLEQHQFTHCHPDQIHHILSHPSVHHHCILSIAATYAATTTTTFTTTLRPYPSSHYDHLHATTTSTSMRILHCWFLYTMTTLLLSWSNRNGLQMRNKQRAENRNRKTKL